MTTTALAVSDMHCGACSAAVERALNALASVQRLQINPVRRHVLVTHDDDVDAALLIQRLETAGFHPSLLGATSARLDDPERLLPRLGIAGLFAMQVMMVQFALYAGDASGMDPVVRRLLHLLGLVLTIPLLSYCALPFFRNAFTRRLHMDTPIALALACAAAISAHSVAVGQGNVYFDSIAMFTFLMLLARVLELRTRQRLHANDSLVSLFPAHVRCRVDGSEVRKRVTEVVEGDEIFVGEGELLPVDAVSRRAVTLDLALVSGESEWRNERAGVLLPSGACNRSAGCWMRVCASPADSYVARIDALVDREFDVTSRVTEIATRVAAVFVPAVVGVSVATFAGWQFVDPSRAIDAALAVLVVSCPCALSLATPAALTAGAARLRQLGIIVRDASALERSAKALRVDFDKTGTLTDVNVAEPLVTVFGGFTRDFVLGLAAVLERASSHPLSRPFQTGRGTRSETMAAIARDMDGLETLAGSGVRGHYRGSEVRIGSRAFTGFTGVPLLTNNAVYLTVAERDAAAFEIPYRVRPDAEACIRGLQNLGLEVAVLSGDTPDNCRDLGARLRIDAIGGQKPEQKMARVGDAGIFVGDGINDLPALSHAGVSVAVPGATDLVRSRSGVVLLTGRLTGVVDLVRVARRTMRILRQNLGWAVAYNVIAIPVAVSGWLTPWLAALGMSASSLLVLLNASRLLSRRDIQEAG